MNARDREALMLDHAAWSYAIGCSYRSLEHELESVAAFKAAVRGEDLEDGATRAAVDGYAAGRLHRHQTHGGARDRGPASVEVMAATVASDSAEIAPVSAGIGR